MEKDFLNFQNFIKSNSIKETNPKLEPILKDYTFLFVSDDFNFDKNQIIKQNLNESKILIIDQFDPAQKDKYFIFSFEKSILIFDHISNSIFQQIFTINRKIEILFLSNLQFLSENLYQIQNNIKKPNKFFNSEITNFCDNFKLKQPEKSSITIIFKSILPCIAGYLIQKSYQKTNKDRFEEFNSQKERKIEFEINDYIELRLLGIGSSFIAELIYHIKHEELFVIKKPKHTNEKQKLITRNLENCRNLNHHLIPKFYGKVKDSDYFIMEYINGQSLMNIDMNSLTLNEKYLIIGQLIQVIEFLNDKKFIYRDLKPDNIIIDMNKQAIIVDFDRMIKFESKSTTLGFSNWSAPEVNEGKPSYTSDVYSLGKLINFILKDKSQSDSDIQQIINKCIEIDPKKRISIEELYNLFCFHIAESQDWKNSIDFYNKAAERDYFMSFHIIGYIYQNKDIEKAIYYYKLSSKLNDPKSQYNLGTIYYGGEFVQRDMSKAIKYFQYAANNNFPQAQHILGYFYDEGKYIKKDGNKAIHYYMLAANNNYCESMFNLGIIYEEGKYVTRDINKAMHYYLLATQQNHCRAHYNLGYIYLNEQFHRDINKAVYYFTLASDNFNYPNAQHELGNIYCYEKNFPTDVNKGIHYYSLAANQNFALSLYQLGLMYYEGEIVSRDINKSINYYTKAASLNYTKAQYNLGILYSENKYVPVNIEKAIYYLSIAAEKNVPQAQYNLALIYSRGEYIARDFIKSFNYYIRAAENNHYEAQYNLGVIYNQGKGVPRNINKAIHYYTLSANQNYPDAQYNLGVIYYNEKDFYKSIYYFTLAANQGHTVSHYVLGVIYYKGKFVRQDIKKSIFHFTQASDKNDIKSQLFLGKIYIKNKYIKRDIDKALHYFTLAAKQNSYISQFNLGLIYLEGKYVVRDINKAIYYFELSAHQNYSDAQLYLGCIYFEGKYINRDFKKAIYYFQQAEKNNNSCAMNYLGAIYIEGKFVEKDINKALEYFTRASELKNILAQFNLGLLYFRNQNFNKSIYYFTLSANNGLANAQYYLGYIYLNGIYIEENAIKGLDFLIQASKNGHKKADFILGCVYHKGKDLNQDIYKSISYYKKSSSFNIHYAKNNLGVIYKNGFDDEIQPNIVLAKEYFNEAIRQKNDFLSMHNLANILMFEENDLDKSIELLVNASNNDFYPSKQLLCLALVKKFGLHFENIENEIEKFAGKNNNLYQQMCCMMINNLHLDDPYMLEIYYQKFKNNDFLYSQSYMPVLLKYFNENRKKENINELKNTPNSINKDFYQGFGLI